MIIYYDANKAMCKTQCPFRECDTKVGSISCRDCPYFIRANYAKKFVDCRAMSTIRKRLKKIREERGNENRD